MIGKTLQFTNDLLEQYFSRQSQQAESQVMLGSPVATDGTILPRSMNKILLTLVNVDKSGSKTPISLGYKQTGNVPASAVKGGNCILYLLVSANFTDYLTGLQFLDDAGNFFEENKVVDAHAHSTIPPGIAKLEFTAESISYEQSQSIWAALGARYLPSVVYKITVTAG